MSDSRETGTTHARQWSPNRYEAPPSMCVVKYTPAPAVWILIEQSGGSHPRTGLVGAAAAAATAAHYQPPGRQQRQQLGRSHLSQAEQQRQSSSSGPAQPAHRACCGSPPAGSRVRMAALKAAAWTSPISAGGTSTHSMLNWAARLVPAGALGADSSVPRPSACVR